MIALAVDELVDAERRALWTGGWGGGIGLVVDVAKEASAFGVAGGEDRALGAALAIVAPATGGDVGHHDVRSAGTGKGGGMALRALDRLVRCVGEDGRGEPALGLFDGRDLGQIGG